MKEFVVEAQAVTKVYPGPAGGADVEVLNGVSLDIAPGESVAIVGPSGSGKSTLLNLIGALDRPTAGRVLLLGRDLTGLSEDELARIRNREIGFVFQRHHLLPQLTVLENALVPALAERGATPPVDRARALLERVGLASRLDHRPGELSGGECQRVAVVRALVNGPGLVLADEPTGSLDAASAIGLTDLLAELNRAEGVALVVVTHSEALASRMGRTYRLAGGRLAGEATDRR